MYTKAINVRQGIHGRVTPERGPAGFVQFSKLLCFERVKKVNWWYNRSRHVYLSFTCPIHSKVQRLIIFYISFSLSL